MAGIGAISYVEYARRLLPDPGESDAEINTLTSTMIPGKMPNPSGLLSKLFSRFLRSSGLLARLLLDCDSWTIDTDTELSLQVVQGSHHQRSPGRDHSSLRERTGPQQ